MNSLLRNYNQSVCFSFSQVDETSGFQTKTILCMPIQNSNGEIMGVVQLLNKMDNTPFNANDENLFEVNTEQVKKENSEDDVIQLRSFRIEIEYTATSIKGISYSQLQLYRNSSSR